jgi:hypothetical protein
VSGTELVRFDEAALDQIRIQLALTRGRECRHACLSGVADDVVAVVLRSCVECRDARQWATLNMPRSARLNR